MVLLFLLMLSLFGSIKVAISTNRNDLILHLYLFKHLKLANMHVYIKDNEVFLQVYNFKPINLSQNRQKHKSVIFAAFPKIIISKLILNFNINDRENALVPIFTTMIINGIMQVAKKINQDLILIKSVKTVIYPAFDQTSIKINMNFALGFNVFRIISWLFRTLMINLFTKTESKEVSYERK